jgi:3,4-dihydroxy-2-butanone 4-phosphate synthase
VEQAIADIRDGKFVVVADDEDRENEGDLVCAAQHVTPEMVNFMLDAKGMICLALTPERCAQLDLPLMSEDNTEAMRTAFTVSIDAAPRFGVTTGISAADRAATIRVAADPGSQPRDLRRPGHIHPLRARGGGVLQRVGHTEAAVDLARLAGLRPAGVICEILNRDGTTLPQPCAGRGHSLAQVGYVVDGVEGEEGIERVGFECEVAQRGCHVLDVLALRDGVPLGPAHVRYARVEGDYIMAPPGKVEAAPTRAAPYVQHVARALHQWMLGQLSVAAPQVEAHERGWVEGLYPLRYERCPGRSQVEEAHVAALPGEAVPPVPVFGFLFQRGREKLVELGHVLDYGVSPATRAAKQLAALYLFHRAGAVLNGLRAVGA